MKSQAEMEQIEEHSETAHAPDTLDVLDVLLILAKRRMFLLWFTLGAAALAAVVVMLIPNRYTASTVLLPPNQSSSASSALLSQLGGSGALASAAGASLGIKNPADMYVALFRSRVVEDGIVEKFGLQQRYHKKRLSDAREALEKHSSITSGLKDGLLHLTVEDRDPKFAADMANGYVDQYRKLSAHLAVTEAAQRRAFFEQQLLDAHENLAKAEEAMKQTEQSTGVLQIDSQARSLIESAAALRAQIAAKEVQISAMHSYAAPDNPDLAVANQQLSAMKGQLAMMAGNGGTGSDLLIPRGKVPEAGLEYIRKLRDVKYYEAITELLARQYESAKLDEAKEGTVIQVVDPAVPPDKRSFPKRGISVVVAGMMGFVIACAWVFIREGLKWIGDSASDQTRIQELRALFL